MPSDETNLSPCSTRYISLALAFISSARFCISLLPGPIEQKFLLQRRASVVEVAEMLRTVKG